MTPDQLATKILNRVAFNVARVAAERGVAAGDFAETFADALVAHVIGDAAKDVAVDPPESP